MKDFFKAEENLNEKIELMYLRPAVYNGEEAEIRMHFENARIFRTCIAESQALDMKAGDTVSICGRLCSEDKATPGKYCTLYMSEDVLTDFTKKFGISEITADVHMKVSFTYSMYNGEDFCGENRKKEICGFKLLEIF